MFDGRGPGLPVFSLTLALGLLTLALGQGGCASGRAQPPLVAAPGQSVEHLDAGRGLFAGHCQNCHTLPEPRELAPAAWPRKVAIMARKSGLSQAQIALVSDYLVAASRQTPASRNLQ
jgi:mono/diheme cytochrome c family protein